MMHTGVRTSALWGPTVPAAQNHVAVRTTASATTRLDHVFVSRASWENPATSVFVPKATLACTVAGSVRATSRTLAGTCL